MCVCLFLMFPTELHLKNCKTGRKTFLNMPLLPIQTISLLSWSATRLTNKELSVSKKLEIGAPKMVVAHTLKRRPSVVPALKQPLTSVLIWWRSQTTLQTPYACQLHSEAHLVQLSWTLRVSRLRQHHSNRRKRRVGAADLKIWLRVRNSVYKLIINKTIIRQ